MKPKTITYCGKCGHAGVKRETRKSKLMNFVYAIYSCENENCDRAEGIVLMAGGSKADRWHCGNLEQFSKKTLDNLFHPNKTYFHFRPKDTK